IWEEFKAYLVSNSFPLGNDDPVDLLLKEFVDELALTESFPPGNYDMTLEDVIKEIEYLLNRDPLAEYSPNNDLIYTIPEMFNDEHTLDYSSPPRYDDLFDLKTDNDEWGKILYDDPFESKKNKIKDSKLLIDELDSPGSSSFLPHFLLECDLVFYEDFFEATMEKNVKKLSNASLILEDFNPPLYELPFHKEVPGSKNLLSFSSENEEKVFNPGILTSKGVHTSLLPELSHQGSKAFNVIKIFESAMEIFPCSYGEDILILDVSCLHFYPP
ncbi:hypothetical protein Tco_0107481, partial [Tanacetum coccineum]